MWEMCPEKMHIFTKKMCKDGPAATKVRLLYLYGLKVCHTLSVSHMLRQSSESSGNLFTIHFIQKIQKLQMIWKSRTYNIFETPVHTIIINDINFINCEKKEIFHVSEVLPLCIHFCSDLGSVISSLVQR